MSEQGQGKEDPRFPELVVLVLLILAALLVLGLGLWAAKPLLFWPRF